jgi:hypothetical protein
MATHNTRGVKPKDLSKLIDAETWLEPVHGGHAVCYWSVGRGSWWIQSRDPKASSYLRRLKSARRVGYAVMGNHLTIYTADCSVRKFRGILKGLRTVTKGHLVSLEPD